MLGELFSELRAQARERIRNPLLGPFSAAWIVTNWRLLSVLVASDASMEQRIAFIDNNYLDVINLIITPFVFAVFYALALPWMNLGLQHLQEGVNLRRKRHTLMIDTESLRASVGRAEAQADLNRILAKDQVAREQKQEIDALRQQLVEQEERARSRIEATEQELEQRRKEYEARSNQDLAAAAQERLEIERLRTQLEDERAQAVAESERVRDELKKRRAELEFRLDEQPGHRLISTNIEFAGSLLSRRFRLFHNPSVGPERSKPISFAPQGRIVEGRNRNEHSWRIVDGKLELVQADGLVHSRFFYFPESEIFVHTGDTDTPSARGQYIIPDKG
jgi:hypothetical protein